jgi:hypothetical protein
VDALVMVIRLVPIDPPAVSAHSVATQRLKILPDTKWEVAHRDTQLAPDERYLGVRFSFSLIAPGSILLRGWGHPLESLMSSRQRVRIALIGWLGLVIPA